MEAKRARDAIREAALQTVASSARWDRAIVELAEAWRGIMAADQVMRLNRLQAGSENDSGRMEARLLHPRAMFSMSVALADAKFPLPYGFIRECGMSEKLADYVGADPASDYVVDSSSPPCDESGAAAATDPVAVAAVRHKRRKHRRQARVRVIVPQEAPA